MAMPGVFAEEPLVSTMRNVNAVMEARGFHIVPAPDLSGDFPLGDEAPVLAVEIIRPRGERVTLGRLFTSCSCVQLESDKRVFEEGERAILRFRNVKPTPPEGQVYAMYVQLTGPIRTTLRYDTFLQSSRFAAPPAAIAEPIFTAAAEPAGEAAKNVSPENAAETPERDAPDKYSRVPETGESRTEGETEAFKAAMALRELKERETEQAAKAILETEKNLALKLSQHLEAAERLKTREEEERAAAAALEEAKTLEAVRREEVKALEAELEAFKREKELKEGEVRKATVAIEALKEIGN
ncbi:MAG: hypothetical protein LBU64_10360 [Planctomycetota bacterium]|jgi:hypothetical protein|nr:hypothetical protein [Planctomycetota bacterium]